MNDTNVVDLVKAQERDPASVPIRERVRRRIEVLNEWITSGIPDGKLASLPTSLRKAKDWSDETLGILPIGSPNDFTTKHVEWGRDVATIARLLTKLKQRHGRPNAKSGNRQPRPDSEPIKLMEAQLTEAVSQWHSAREEAIEQRNRADAEAIRVARLTETLTQKEAEVAELRRRLMQSGAGLRAID